MMSLNNIEDILYSLDKHFKEFMFMDSNISTNNERFYYDSRISLFVSVSDVIDHRAKPLNKASLRINISESTSQRKAVINFDINYGEDLDIESLIFLGTLSSGDNSDILENWYDMKKVERRDIIINNLLNE